MNASAPVAQTVLSMEQVRFRWPQGQRDVLHIPELSLQAGERLFIKGSSGSGKTTLLSLIGGVNSPQQGRVKLLGQDLLALRQGRRDQFRADHIGFIFQQFNLIPYLSVLDNILLSCRFSPRRTERALARSGTLAQEAQRLLQHLQLQDPGLCQRPVLELSVGQQQRVACARALIGEPELIIADEPTSALDADARQSFLQLLLDECAACDASILFVSHDTSLENAFDRSVNLHELNLASAAVAGEVV